MPKKSKKDKPFSAKVLEQVVRSEEPVVFAFVSSPELEGTKKAIFSALKSREGEPLVVYLNSFERIRIFTEELRQIFWRGGYYCITHRVGAKAFEGESASCEFRRVFLSDEGESRSKLVKLTSNFQSMAFIFYRSIQLQKRHPGVRPSETLKFVLQYYGTESPELILVCQLDLMGQYSRFFNERDQMVDADPRRNNNISSLRCFFSRIEHYASLLPGVLALCERYDSLDTLAEAYRHKLEGDGVRVVAADMREIRLASVIFSVDMDDVFFSERLAGGWQVTFANNEGLRAHLAAELCAVLLGEEASQKYIAEMERAAAEGEEHFELGFEGHDLRRLRNCELHLKANTGLLSQEKVARYSQLIGPIATPPARWPEPGVLSLGVPPAPRLSDVSMLASQLGRLSMAASTVSLGS